MFDLPTHANVTISGIRKIKKKLGLTDAQFNDLMRGAVEGSIFPDLQSRPRIPKGTPIRTLQTVDRIDSIIGFPADKAREGVEWAGEKAGDAKAWAIGLIPGLSGYPRVRKGLRLWWEDSASIAGPVCKYFSDDIPALKPFYETHWGGATAWQHGTGSGQSAQSIQSSLVGGTEACLTEFSACAGQGNWYDAGFALGKALHYLQDTHTPSHVQRNSVGQITAFYDYNLQSPTRHAKADKPSWWNPVYRNAVRQTQGMVLLFLSGNAGGIGEFFEAGPTVDVGIPGEGYERRSGAISPMDLLRGNY